MKCGDSVSNQCVRRENPQLAMAHGYDGATIKNDATIFAVAIESRLIPQPIHFNDVPSYGQLWVEDTKSGEMKSGERARELRIGNDSRHKVPYLVGPVGCQRCQG